MLKILLAESDNHDAGRFHLLIPSEEFQIAHCQTGIEAETFITANNQQDFAAAIISWEIEGVPSAFALLARCRQLWPNVPVVITCGALDARLATRAFAMGAKDFLEKPLDSERIKSCLKTLLAKHDSFSPLVDELRQSIVGESASLLSTLRQMAKLIPHTDSRALFIGESGTGKELFAQAIHKLGQRKNSPLVTVNIGEISATLIESLLFGHEKGSFTGAASAHVGYLEESGEGTLFLDEIGEMDLALQVKLLRVIQEKEFRRIGSNKVLPFRARLVCATNRDLAQEVLAGRFRSDLYHRIAEKIIHIPALRERKGDIDILLYHFLNKYSSERQLRFARESLTILRSYSFPGNVRELQNLVRGALIECDGETILPNHLPLPNMAAFLTENEAESPVASIQPKSTEPGIDLAYRELVIEIIKTLPPDWLKAPYKEMAKTFEQVFDRIYLPQLFDRAHENVTRAAKIADVDTKTFRKRWKDCGLPPLGTREDEIS